MNDTLSLLGELTSSTAPKAYVKYAVLLRINEPENRTPMGKMDLVYKSRLSSASR
jgi:hypothetical protein